MNKFFHKCRFCLKLGEFCSIFEKDESMTLSDMVMSFAKVQIFQGDGITDRVCCACIETLSTAYLFKLQCEKIDELLRENTENNIETDISNILENDFHVHSEHGVVQKENYDNCIKDNIPAVREISDDTDSDLESIKCVYCDQLYNSHGAHTCRVTCTIENRPSSNASDETLVAGMESHYFSANSTLNSQTEHCEISCVLCDMKYDKYADYVEHINVCTANVKLHFFVCPLCHEINTEKDAYLSHLNASHFKENIPKGDKVKSIMDVVDRAHLNKSARRQIGWSLEDIYQEIEPDEQKVTPTSSPLKYFFSKLGNETFSRNSTPRKRVSFRQLIEDGKAKSSNYIPFKKIIQGYKMKKKEALYSSVLPKSKREAHLKITISDSDYGSPSNTSEESWKLKQNLICACRKNIFMLSEHLEDRERISSMITELGGVVADNTKLEMLATHFIAVIPKDSYSGMMVCALATGKWLLHVNFVYDSFRGKKFLNENLYEWTRHPQILDVDNTSIELAKAATYWHRELSLPNCKMPFEGMQVVLIMKKKYRQYYQMIFKTLKAKAIAYDPRTPGICCSADYCFADMKIIERVKLRFFASHNIPVFPYQYILVYLLNRGKVDDEYKYLLQDCRKTESVDTVDVMNNTF